MNNNFKPNIWDKSDDHNTTNILIRSSSTKSLNQVNSNNATMFSSDDESKWTVRNSKINLPAVLNDPTLSRRRTDLFSKNWGESFEKVIIMPSQHIKKITENDFTTHQSKLLARLKKNSQSLDNLNPFYEKPKYDILKPENEQIPKIFLQNEFDLTDHQTYNDVFSLNKHSLKLLQEKLSHFLDLVEVQITKQISLKSESFFTALIAQNELQSYLTRTLSTVSFIRGKVKYLNSVYVEQPLKLLQLVNKRNKYLEVYEKFKLISTIQQTQPMIQSLLSTNDFLGAVDLISTTKETLDVELGGVVCFRHLGSQLLEIERLIERMISEEFSRFITSFLNQPIDDQLIVEDLFTLHESFNEEHLVLIILGSLRQHKFDLIAVLQSESSTAIRTLVKQTVIHVVSSLDHADGDASGLAHHMRLLYYEQWMNLMDLLFHNLLILLKRIQLICHVFLQVSKSVSQKIPQVQNDIQTDSFVDEISLTNSHIDIPFIHPLLEEYDGLIMNDDAISIDAESASFDGPISSINVMSNGDQNSHIDEMIEDIPKSIVTSLSEAESFLSSEEHAKVTTLLGDCLKFVGDHTQERCQRILVARGKDGFMDKLSVSEFVRLHECIETNIVKIEKITHSHSTVLRNNLQNLTNKFVTKFHEERKNKLCLILDNELWKPSQVPVEFQDLVDHILISGNLELPLKKTDGDGRQKELLTVNSEKFAVVGTTLMLLKMMIEYCEFCNWIPSASVDLLSRLVELLKIFNSRTCQLVLGAGALHLVGLKTITTKNLGLASRCLQLIALYLPLLKAHFCKHLHKKQLNMIKHFEHLSKDYQDHINEIESKLVSILYTVLQGSFIKFEVKSSTPSNCFKNISKQISKFHEAIYNVLPDDQIYRIFEKFHHDFMEILRQHLSILGITNDNGPQYLSVIADINFYISNIKSLPNFSHFTLPSNELWLKKDE